MTFFLLLVLRVLEHPDGTKLSSRELKNMGQEHPTSGGVAASYKDGSLFRVPSRKTAIAGVLISEWAYGRISNADVKEGDVVGKSRI